VATVARRRLTVTGIVQGVGFRPFVYALATRLGLCGFVGNDSTGVFIEVEGERATLDAFGAALRAEVPPLAHIHAVEHRDLAPRGDHIFTIVQSEARPAARTFISPDLSICDDCLRELFDSSDRRYRYPFITCTNCGPRFTIIRDIPYDRPFTTMAGFPLCAACRAEYENPADRRYHAQPIACPECGPRVWLTRPGEAAPLAEGETAIVGARHALSAGTIVAIKGLGGFHLACEATDGDAVELLRTRKGRGAKPFAVMVRNLAAARRLAWIDDAEAERLSCRERPIVLLRKRADSPLADGVAPGNDAVGIMLPYTPLHYLIVGDRPLVMTSGNIAGEPIAIDNGAALTQLGGVADVFLLHDRPIHVPCDDSVLRVFRGHDLPVRRSRGYAPFPIQLPVAVQPTLAAGGELKCTLCLAVDGQAVLSQHIGDMENLETLEAFSRAAAHLQLLFRVEPQRMVCDLHPGYLSTRWAERLAAARAIPLLRVQHHHAHVAAVLAEHGYASSMPVLGVGFDGTGYGPDGAIWGGEFLVADYHGYHRAAHLAYVPLPGGDAAIERPYRVALAHLQAAGLAWDEQLAPVAACGERERRILAQQCAKSINSVPTSSMGRLFDAVASLLGVRQRVSYEGQAAIELQALASIESSSPYHFAVREPEEPEAALVADPAPVLAAIVQDLRRGVPVSFIAGWFHLAVADLTLAVACRLREEHGLHTLALSGGVFQNALLLAQVVDSARSRGFTVLTHRLVPPNDGGLALGQAAIGGHQ
jgi:hydrogenase maturation protein HypF